MPGTDGRWTQQTSNPDMQIFFGPSAFVDTAAHAVLSFGEGGFVWTVPETDASIFVASLPLLLRTGVYATPAYDQEQFGTAASQPGPSAVPFTSGPSALPVSGAPNFQGFPPFPGSQMATLAGPMTGPTPKGIQIDSIDVIYSVLTLDAAAAEVTLFGVAFVNGEAPVTTTFLNNAGLALTAAANPYVVNTPNPTPEMLVTADNEINCLINFTAGATGTVAFYGVVLHCHFNFN